MRAPTDLVPRFQATLSSLAPPSRLFGSPYKLVAKARDAKVPYSFPFSRKLKADNAAAAAAAASGAAQPAPSISLPSLSLPIVSLPKLPF